MIMPAIRCIAPILIGVMFLNRNPAVSIMMMVFIDANLNRAMLCLVHRPSRYRRNHAKREPAKCEQVQQGADTVIHRIVSRRCRKNGQSGKCQVNQ